MKRETQTDERNAMKQANKTALKALLYDDQLTSNMYVKGYVQALVDAGLVSENEEYALRLLMAKRKETVTD